MKKLGVVITDGVGYRNFILSDFIKESIGKFDEVVIFSCLPEHVYLELNFPCKIVELDVFEEPFKTWFFRKAKEVSHLQLHSADNFGISDNLKANYSRSKNPRGMATRFIFKWSKYINSENWILRYNLWQQKTFKSNPVTLKYKQLLKEHGIDLLFFTHQRPPYIAPMIYAAEQLKIKTAAFIFSWDNLASKGRMAGNFNYYLVWSDLMKTELLHFYKSVKQHTVKVVGTPQFEPYVLQRYGMSEAAFYQKFKLDASKPTVLFSCGDVSTSPNDPLYIETIAKAILENEIVKPVNLLIRTSPAEEPSRFEALANNYPFIVWNYPDWKQARSRHQESWSQRIPSVQDVTDLKSVLQYSSVNVNMLSTMSLDSMLFNKPVVNTVFGNPDNKLAHDQRFLNYAHIKKVVDSNAVRIAKSPQELISAINESLFHPENKLIEQKKLIDLQIGRPLEGTSERIAQTLLNLL
ncbi:hypothetical protein LZZ90_07040 [Flavobacterium sp. SM15]|uniref:hypothetical protein n=1 Tax=Flavobacterium sp. SM15 TaxID=2908005 RepID=UPI001EDBBE26|nr:hypothetical protein [Flavobacterium sp. SM15]MCG2611257.1 hypothetical protein [Flavobacterium sp. SM15]